jgi:tetratricopeptide (TPR) repeat protein
MSLLPLMKRPGFPCAALVRALAGATLACAIVAGAQEAPTPAAPVPGTPATPVAPDAPSVLSAVDAYAEFRRHFDAGDHARAVEAAQAVVVLAERAAPPDGESLQVAVMNLALAQQLAGDHAGAAAGYQRVIGLIEASGRLASPRLARAHAGLAIAYYSARRYDLAAAAFEQAIALNRRAEGLFNDDQLPLLEKQADALTQLGRFDDALQAQRYALRVVDRRHGERSLRYAGQLETLGRWYARVGAYEGARTVILKSLALTEELEGPASLRLVGPLTALADNAQRWLFDPQARAQSAGEDERRAMFHDSTAAGLPGLSASTIATEGLRALERAAALADSAPEPSPPLVAAIRTQLGDWYQSRLDVERSLPQYQRAWHAATRAGVEGGRPLTERLFGQPQLLQYTPVDGWNRYAERPADEAERRIVEIEVTVSAQGTPRDPQLLSDGGTPKFASRTLQSVESARYRPRFADGEPVETAGVRFLQPVYVLIGEENAPAQDAPGEAAAAAPDRPDAPPPVQDPG